LSGDAVIQLGFGSALFSNVQSSIAKACALAATKPDEASIGSPYAWRHAKVALPKGQEASGVFVSPNLGSDRIVQLYFELAGKGERNLVSARGSFLLTGGRRERSVELRASSLGCVSRIEHEYALKAELDGDWAVRPVTLARHNDRMTLVLEDPGGVLLDRLLGRPLEVWHFLRIAIPRTSALRQVHERGTIHKDIKPANILANEASGSVRLTGFGIASRLPRERALAKQSDIEMVPLEVNGGVGKPSRWCSVS
jgi:serine/threonine protein kinase